MREPHHFRRLGNSSSEQVGNRAIYKKSARCHGRVNDAILAAVSAEIPSNFVKGIKVSFDGFPEASWLGISVGEFGICEHR
jgi:hypothetical protein